MELYSSYLQKIILYAKNIIHKKGDRNMNIQQIRNATVKITYGGSVFLIDPMFAPKDAYPPIPMCFTPDRRWPMVDLPMSEKEILQDVDAVIMTHYHIDHFDEFAMKAISKDMKIFVQDEEDRKTLEGFGFLNLEILKEEGVSFGNVELYKTNCIHGEREKTIPYFEKVGIRHEAMGVVFKSEGEKTLYLAGDTIWCDFVKEAIDKFSPEVVVVNAADAQLETSGSIIMGTKDIQSLHDYAPSMKIVASHMDTVGHATLDRCGLRKYLKEHNLEDTVLVPEDGENIGI